MRSINSQRVAQIKNEDILLPGPGAPSGRKCAWQEVNLGFRKPSVSWKVVSVLILLWLFLYLDLAQPFSDFSFSSLYIEKCLCSHILVDVTFDTTICDASSQSNSML